MGTGYGTLSQVTVGLTVVSYYSSNLCLLPTPTQPYTHTWSTLTIQKGKYYDFLSFVFKIPEKETDLSGALLRPVKVKLLLSGQKGED